MRQLEKSIKAKNAAKIKYGHGDGSAVMCERIAAAYAARQISQNPSMNHEPSSISKDIGKRAAGAPAANIEIEEKTDEGFEQNFWRAYPPAKKLSAL